VLQLSTFKRNLIPRFETIGATRKQRRDMTKTFIGKIKSQDDSNGNSLSLWSSLYGLSFGWLLWIGWSDSSGTTLLTTALWCLHTTSWVRIHGNIVNLEHLIWYKHLKEVGQLLWLKRYRGKTWFTFLKFQCRALVSVVHGGLLKRNELRCMIRYDIHLLD
jgi:hypothetical protein